jgi:opacity protein-like surface antigen
VTHRRVRSIVVALIACLSGFVARPASAEWFADVFVGVAAPQSEDVDVRLSSPLTKLRYQDVDLDRSVSYGGRFGKYFEGVPWLGLTVDALNFSPDLSQQSAVQTASTGTSARTTLPPISLSVVAISFDLMLRVPLLTTKEIPAGRVQPYVLGGPGVFFVSATDHGNFIRRRQSDVEIVGGFNAGGGITWQFSQALGVFGEYRFSHASPEFEFKNFDGRATVETDINAHHFLLGLSAKF